MINIAFHVFSLQVLWVPTFEQNARTTRSGLATLNLLSLSRKSLTKSWSGLLTIQKSKARTNKSSCIVTSILNATSITSLGDISRELRQQLPCGVCFTSNRRSSTINSRTHAAWYIKETSLRVITRSQSDLRQIVSELSLTCELALFSLSQGLQLL